MKTHVDKNQGKSPEQLNSNTADFNFELWAKQVRPQLLASVQKRGTR